MVAGLFVVVFVFLVDFEGFFLTLPPINMHVQGAIPGYSFLMVCLGGTGFSEQQRRLLREKPIQFEISLAIGYQII